MLKSNFTGEIKVFRNDKFDFPSYSTGVGRKNKDGEYDNAYLELKFKKGTELENGTMIDIKNGFLTFRQYEKDGKKQTIWQIMVIDFDMKGKDEPSGFSQVAEDIPF